MSLIGFWIYIAPIAIFAVCMVCLLFLAGIYHEYRLERKRRKLWEQERGKKRL